MECIYCPKPAQEGYKSCSDCRSRKRKTAENNRRRAIEKGLCIICKNPSDCPTCFECKAKNRLQSKLSKRKKINLSKCRDCNISNHNGKTLCDECLRKVKHRQKVRLRKLREDLRCLNCTEVLKEEFSLKYCKKCRTKINLNNLNIKKLVMNYYGGECNCCGEKEITFLTLDHIMNNGAEERKRLSKKEKGGGGINFYKVVIKSNFPDYLQVLCFNCNLSKHLNKGVCSHKGIQINLDTEAYKTKKKILSYYGEACNCCGLTELLMLSIDHIQGEGSKTRKEHGSGHAFYRWIIRNNFPQGFQVLCINCNYSKGTGESCIHKLQYSNEPTRR